MSENRGRDDEGKLSPVLALAKTSGIDIGDSENPVRDAIHALLESKGLDETRLFYSGVRKGYGPTETRGLYQKACAGDAEAERFIADLIKSVPAVGKGVC